MARPQGHTPEEFLDAAIAIANSEGLDALTARRLGAEMGVSYTAVYTYFENRNALIASIVNRMSQEIISEIVVMDSASTRDVIVGIGMATRRVLSQHPLLVPAFATVDAGDAGDESTVIATIAGLLRSAGLQGDDLVLAYRALESYILGSAIFDLGAAPRHLTIRRRRYQSTGVAEFVAVAKSDRSMAAHNEAAFKLGLERLLDGLGL